MVMSGPHDLVRSSCFHETCSTLPSRQKEQGRLYDNNPVEGYLWLFGFTLSLRTQNTAENSFVFQDTSSKCSHEADTPDLCTDAASVHPEEESPCPPESSPTGAGQLLIAQR